MKTLKKAKIPTNVEAAQQIVIQEPDIRTFEVTIDGLSPLIVHRWSEKAKRQMREKQTKGIKEKKTLKVPEDDFEEAKYRDPQTKQEGMSLLSFKAAIVDAASFVETVSMKYLKGSLFILPDFVDADGTPCVVIKGNAKMREDLVRLSGIGSTADLRYRPIYDPWSVTLRIEFDAGLVTPHQIVNLLNRAGFSIGVGDWRPSSPKGKSGMFGRFRVRPLKREAA